MAQLRIQLNETTQTVHELMGDRITVGRLPSNALQIEDDSVSGRHCELLAERGHHRLLDRGSTNGTSVNGVRVTDVVLNDGDVVRFGRVEATYMTGRRSTVPAVSYVDDLTPGASSRRPARFVNASPFPRPKQRFEPIDYLAIGIGVLGMLGFLAATALSLAMKAPP